MAADPILPPGVWTPQDFNLPPQGTLDPNAGQQGTPTLPPAPVLPSLPAPAEGQWPDSGS
jgi:hypothetical protein